MPAPAAGFFGVSLMPHRLLVDRDDEFDRAVEQGRLPVHARFAQAGLPFPPAFEQPEPEGRKMRDSTAIVEYWLHLLLRRYAPRFKNPFHKRRFFAVAAY